MLVCIRHRSSGLVVDAAESQLALQPYSGSTTQCWVVDGRIIRSAASNNAIDIQGPSEKGASILTYEEHGRPNQQWKINANGIIRSYHDDLVMDVQGGNCAPGATLIAYTEHGKDNQIFDVVVVEN